jgi:glycosyltransferase involved in cell wall biosynthesis
MSSLPLVSIIIPVYNQGRYLACSVESALAQDYPNREILIIDDASTDNTAEVIQSFASVPNLTVHTNRERLDCARNFNHGIELAAGKYFGILAADDTWEPEFIAAAVAALERNPEAAFAYTRINLLDDRGGKTPRRRDRIVHNGDRCGRELENIIRQLNPIPHHATMVRRECIDRVGAYNPELTTTHDWDLWIRLAAAYPVAFVDRFLANYRVHASNISKTRSRLGEKERFIFGLLDRVFGDPDLTGSLAAGKNEIYARACLDIAEGYRVIGERGRMREFFVKAWQFSKNPPLYLKYRRMLWDLLWGAPTRI